MSTEQITALAITVKSFTPRDTPREIYDFSVGTRYHRVNLDEYKAKAASAAPQIMYWVAPKEFRGNQVCSSRMSNNANSTWVNCNEH